MAKGGKLIKLKSVMKKMQSFKLGGSPIVATNYHSSTEDNDCYSNDNQYCYNNDLHPVYVGKSRRKYLVSSDVIHHPLFKELVENSEDSNIVVGCEVVLFEHLLWMLRNADSQLETSLDELVEFYSC